MSKFFSLIFLSICFCVTTYAQTTYKNVTIDRKSSDVKIVVVHNNNPYPCLLNFEYKIGSKDSSWRNYKVDFNNFENVEIKAKETKEIPIYSKIYALKIVYVDIQRPTLGEYIDAFAEGWVEGKQKAQQNQH